MKVTTYKDLVFWQKSYQVSKLIFKLIPSLSQEYSVKVICNQLIRASTSVGANIAEGFGRYVGKEFAHFLTTSIGSATESDYWLLLLKDMQPKYSKEIEEISDLNQEVIKMLYSTIKTLNNK